jgi:adenosylcobinamide kinase/adenosylcobinamide-phosphate guanylyltransferase
MPAGQAGAKVTLPRATLILGGARSGKSRLAQRLANLVAGPKILIATAEAKDAEMAARIAAHRRERGPEWRTVEEPLLLATALDEAAPAGRPVVVDCLTLWLSNLMLAEIGIEPAVVALEAALSRAPGPVILVSNEVGLGIVPENALARAFRDEAGRLNQRMAAASEAVYFLAAGLALTLKGPPPP